MPREILITGRCDVRCPKVRRQLRAEVAKRPWLVDEFFPQRKAADLRFPRDPEIRRDTPRRDEPERVVKPAIIREARIVQETPVVREPIVIKPDDWEIDFAEERELVVERTTIEDGIVEDKIDRKTLKPVKLEETDRQNETVDIVETRPPVVVDKTIIERTKEVPVVVGKTIIEPTKKVPVMPERAETIEVGRTTAEKFEPVAIAEPREKKTDDDYDEFIDEELRKTLPIATAEQIPDEEVVETVRREETPVKKAKINRVERRVGEEEDGKAAPSMVVETVSREPARPSAPSKDTCDDTCPVMGEQRGELFNSHPRSVPPRRKRVTLVLIFPPAYIYIVLQWPDSPKFTERVMRKLEARQRIVDHYYLTRGFSYLEDVCTCSLACVLYTLSRDQFVRSVFASLALFAVGLKLCSELDAWEMPSRVS
ncbi:PREDICTED: uncharacterized protein LOC106745882 [Dinoponera quadriceps]|uniref:Uncharacterized protein LOC106745882 n=1 Tax=Dinoponera quadriceps TaxID=609295 RepID=A0A6P3XG06_DINQU|nr:PREDICTED: uncharacterized protein LOC106745882 [Dinoponera quadriceps]XP_014477356.1 PREDICTED: uncharacterized protein LOC106745882 [Dinoponera quadriceps]XP_014477357.1 PREDICTED: uncharacterized protein LOC106745882 [Dinoponera quadriceps]XP_014477358.1 PREDICTED: uncharacterized protein LOC106745882 [Dinoponera quadriceps]XP_014477359.1 PREDICTED: uncharacterized protein LOC106745882 [Dinoponera quadriceps]